MKCRRCKDRGISRQALVSLPQHNLGLCEPCFLYWYEKRLQETIRQHGMLPANGRILVAVSGGKDSLALWFALAQLDYRVDGLYLDLGIAHEDYSLRSEQYCKQMAQRLSRELIVARLVNELGTDIVTASRLVRAVPCSICGRTKRYYTNTIALRGEYACVATGHNLDDEAASLLANTLAWNRALIERKGPVLPAKPGFVSRVKPLVAFTEKEDLLYCILREIPYVRQECPLSKNTAGSFYKKILNQIESRSPGTKIRFYFGNQDHSRARALPPHPTNLQRCESCGQPTTAPDQCAMCRLKERLQEKLVRPG